MVAAVRIGNSCRCFCSLDLRFVHAYRQDPARYWRSFLLPADTRFLAFGFGSGPAAVSPDESKLAFTAIDQERSAVKLWTRSLKASDAAAIPGTDGAAEPFWSPDGRSLGFFAGGKLEDRGVERRKLADTRR